MTPPEEIERLERTIARAVEAAACGQIGQGYQLLSGGKMEAYFQKQQGKPWGPELFALWQKACDTYATSYGVSLPADDPSDPAQ
jgi:hypothetical protein